MSFLLILNSFLWNISLVISFISSALSHLFFVFSAYFLPFWYHLSFMSSFCLSPSYFPLLSSPTCIYRYSYTLLLPQTRYYPIKAAQCQVRLRQTSLNSHSVSQTPTRVCRNPAPPRQTMTTCSSQKKCHHMPKNSSFQKGRATGQCVRFTNQTAGLCGARETPATIPPPTPSQAFHPRKKRRMEEM